MPHDKRHEPWRQTLVSVMKVAAVPLWAAGLAVVIWSRMPHAQIPSAFQATLGSRNSEHTPSQSESHSQQQATDLGKAQGQTPSHAQGQTQGQASHASGSVKTTPPAASPQNGGVPNGSTDGPAGVKAVNASGFAATHPGKTLVSLGDSITFGYGLPGAATNHPSPDAYPFLVGASQMWHVTDLGVPGWTSTDLLHALGTSKFQRALQKANIVTIDIGSNDLLHASYNFLAPDAQLPAKDAITSSVLIAQALTQFQAQLPEIIADVRKQTDAPIVLLNLYDPFPDASSLHNVGEQMISAANTIIWQVAAENQIPVVDVHAAFNHHQTADVRLDSLDIHPTPSGQQLLAKLVNDTLAHPMNYVPAAFVTSAKGTLVYSQTPPGPFAIGWLHGNQGLLVVGQTTSDWQVVMQDGRTGYVSKKAVTVLLRPFANVQFRSVGVSVQTGSVAVLPDQLGAAASNGGSGATGTASSGQSDEAGSAGSASGTGASSMAQTGGFTYNGHPYVPVGFLASAVGATLTEDASLHQLNLDTPMHSGLLQQGWDSTGSTASSGSTAGSNNTGSTGSATSAGTAAGSGTATSAPALEYVPGQTTKHANLVESAWMLTIDGEPVNLSSPIVEWNGQLFVPLDSVWTSLGGSVTPGKGGLLRLSVAGS